MEKSALIVAVNGIAHNKKGEPINLTVITLATGQRILRQLKPFVTDLKGSSRLLGVDADTITSIDDLSIQKEYKALRSGSTGKGSVTGTFFDVKEGQEYEDENPASPTFGKMLKYKTDHTRVDGFLELRINPEREQMEINADAEIQFKAQLQGLFTKNSVTAVESTIDDLPQELVDELAGEVTEEVAEPKAEKPAK